MYQNHPINRAIYKSGGDNMNDKSIRRILISYLQAIHNEVRIYQEKAIGKSICDVMAVTDKLTGYEIKSDLDNFTRLETQIHEYDYFFDENYIVVSQKHINSVKKEIPVWWGILYIVDDDIRIERTAQKSPVVNRRRQLTLLWKLELKNLLIKNNLPAFAQKEKGYISDKIYSSVESDILGKQIANELLTRDYSVFDAKDYTIHKKQSSKIFDFPTEEIVDTLSEKNLSDFTLDEWISLYQKAKQLQKEKEVKFVEPVKNREKHLIPYTDISVSLGVPWISKDIINEFIDYLMEYKTKTHIVEYEPITGHWHISNKNYYASSNTNATVKYGLPNYNALQIIEATLNIRDIKIYQKNSRTRINEADTLLALEKQKLIINEFQNWIWLDEDRIWSIEEAYNRMFSTFNKETYDGSKLSFPKMNDDFHLFDYQKDAVQKIISTDNTLLAFDVGAGKTFIMIAAAMKMRESGISRKNMFVVPNNIVGQWEKIFTTLYPNAKVLTIEPKVFKPEMRTKVIKQIRDGDYDGIIIAYSCFEMIPLSSTAIISQMEQKMQILNAALGRLRWGYMYASIEREKAYIQKLTADFLHSMDEKPDITFDSLEINTLFIDEAHNYKNLPLRTNLKNINGINSKGSRKCLDMLHKVRCVQSQNNGRGVVFATGTPLCNSISDVYSMQVYLQFEELQKLKLDCFDNWVKTFAMPEQCCEIDVDTSKYRFVRRFAKFFNLPELSKMFSQIAIYYATANSSELPEFCGYKDVIIEYNEPLKNYMQKLCERTEKIRNHEVEKFEDNMLKVSTDGRKAALDLTLVGEHQQYDETSKIKRCVDNLIKNYHKFDGCSQLVFCDYSTPKGEDFSVYKELKSRLVSRGIKEKEIAFIHSYNTELRKVKLFSDVNSGKVRILIGSTLKLGIGANVQTKLKAIHHLDVPWRPADMVQREGRILRRGNENKDVFIYRYIAQGSFDSYSWQILETKQRFISQFLSGSSYQRSQTDLDNNVLTYAEVKALALSQPLMKLLAEKENEISNLRILNSKEIAERETLNTKLEKTRNEISRLKAHLNATIKNQLYLEFTNIAYNLENQIHKDKITPEVLSQNEPDKLLFFYCGFKVKLPKTQGDKKKYIVLQRETDYLIEMGDSPSGNLKRISNFLKSFDKTVDKVQEQYANAQENETQILKQLSTPRKYETMLELCKKERDEIMSMIEIYDATEPIL